MTREQINELRRTCPEQKELIIAETLALMNIRKYEFKRLCTLTATPWRVAVEYLESNPTEFLTNLTPAGHFNEISAVACAKYLMAHGKEHLDAVKSYLYDAELALTV